MALECSSDGVSISLNGDQYSLNGFSHCVFWWRLKPDFTRSVEFKDIYQRIYWTRHWAHLQESIHRLSNARSVNRPQARMQARLKPVQLAKAVSIGLTIPRTAISNAVPPRALGDKIFFKPLTADRPAEGASPLPDQFSRVELEALENSIGFCPGIFQEYCEKQYELRVCVFGDAVFPFAIDSQAVNGAELDWRRVLLPDKAVTETSLTTNEAAKCRMIVKELGLDYGVLDLIRNRDGELVFLEVNPDGQWLWLERQTGFDLSGPFAQFLAGFLPR